VIEVLAAEAPELPDALTRALADGAAFVILDGKVIPGRPVPGEDGRRQGRAR